MRNAFERVVSWFYTWLIWGPRCDFPESGCPCCDKWMEHDDLFGGRT